MQEYREVGVLRERVSDTEPVSPTLVYTTLGGASRYDVHILEGYGGAEGWCHNSTDKQYI